MAPSIYKWLILLTLGLVSGSWADRHPLHLSVVEINHNAADKTLEISCKIFADDFERVLGQNYKVQVNLMNPTDAVKKEMDKLVSDYVQKHLSIRAGNQDRRFSYVGFEKEDEVIYSYFQVDNVEMIQQVEITDKLMHDLFDDQISLIHVIVNGKRKSTKLNYPAAKAVFSF